MTHQLHDEDDDLCDHDQAAREPFTWIDWLTGGAVLAITFFALYGLIRFIYRTL